MILTFRKPNSSLCYKLCHELPSVFVSLIRRMPYTVGRTVISDRHDPSLTSTECQYNIVGRGIHVIDSFAAACRYAKGSQMRVLAVRGVGHVAGGTWSDMPASVYMAADVLGPATGNA